MFKRLILNDLRNNRLTTISLGIFMTLAALLVSLSIILFINLFASINSLMEVSETPDFLQMHTGDLDQERLDDFIKANQDIEKAQVLPFLNIDNSLIVFESGSLKDSVQDHGLTIQSSSFDYLLDLNNEIIRVEQGQIYLPLNYADVTQVNQTVSIVNQEFEVAGFLRDSQMNSSLSSSKRFLVHPNDLLDLMDNGRMEYLIEFKLVDQDLISQFSSAYQAAQLESNGPTLTYSLFVLVNGISYGMMSGLILLLGVIILLIALFNLRLMLLSQMTQETSQIAIMKAIGLSRKEISKTYGYKYILVLGVSLVLGWLLSMATKDILLNQIRLTYGPNQLGSIALLSSIGALVVLALIIILMLRRMISKFSNISVRDGLNGTIQKNKSRVTSLKNFSLPISLAIKEIKSEKKLYKTLWLVFFLSTFLVLLPTNIYQTISQKSFVQVMGIGQSDLRIDAFMNAETDQLLNDLNQDPHVVDLIHLETKKYVLDDGTRMNIELGNHDVYTISYVSGKAPRNDSDIALSILMAQDLEVTVGDKIKVEDRELIVSGLYSDITQGGKTSKALFKDDERENLYQVILFNSLDADASQKTYSSLYPDLKVSHLETYIQQTFSSTIEAFKIVSQVSLLVAGLLIIVTTTLFTQIIVHKEKKNTALLSALGFNQSVAKKMIYSTMLLVVVTGVLMGMIVTKPLGQIMASQVLRLFGVSNFTFDLNPFITYLLFPLSIILIVSVIVIINSKTSQSRELVTYLKEV